jgi:AcrR family transcriptional regulator
MVEVGESARTDAILDAAFALLRQVGYDRLTMDAVAVEARASKATIYRHWPGKAELVADAVRCCSSTAADVPDTGSMRGDLLAVMDRMATAMASEDGAVVRSLLAAAPRDPQLSALMRNAAEGKRAVWQVVVERAVARGDISDGADRTDILAEVAPAVAFFAVAVNGVAPDESWRRHIVDDVLIPVLTARPTEEKK